MPCLKSRVPSYCLHKGPGRAVVTIDGRDHYLGAYESEESRRECERLVAERRTRNRRIAEGGAVSRPVKVHGGPL